jgi:hypothetical protein
MLTIENIHNIKLLTNSLRVGGERWQLSNIQTASDLYQFVFTCIESYQSGVLGRESVINLYREDTMQDLQLGQRVYELKCITNNKSRLLGINDLKEPGLVIYPMLRVIQGC